ncbi:MAG: DUF1800 family protein [Phycisphaerae bacterium]
MHAHRWIIGGWLAGLALAFGVPTLSPAWADDPPPAAPTDPGLDNPPQTADEPAGAEKPLSDSDARQPRRTARSKTAASALRPLDEKYWDHAAAAHLLRRAGFGGTPEEVDRLVALGLSGAVESLVNYQKTEYDTPAAFIPELVREPYNRAILRAAGDEERRKLIAERQMAERRAHEETRLWWLDRMIHSPRPFEEKLTLFWHGHFTSGAREVRNAIFMKDQNELLRRYAAGNFRDLLMQISRDRAMLVYLDGAKNVKKQPNENFARELLELFTLGVGNYSESDIKAAARAFTGWAYNDEGFQFRRRDHDTGPKTFLGKTGPWDGGDIIDIILDRPQCSQFLARTILEFFVRPEPDRALVNALAVEIRKNKYELKPVFETLFKSQAFYSEASRGALVKCPTEVVVGTARQLGLPIADLFSAERAMAGMGQELMQPPNVKGWDGGAKWINTATLHARYNYVGRLIHGQGDGAGARAARRMMAKASNDEALDGEEKPAGMMSTAGGRTRIGGDKQPKYDAVATLRRYAFETAEEVVDHYTQHLLATPLAAEKREQLIAYLRGEDGAFRLEDADAGDRLRTLVHLICSTPEYQMN